MTLSPYSSVLYASSGISGTVDIVLAAAGQTFVVQHLYAYTNTGDVITGVASMDVSFLAQDTLRLEMQGEWDLTLTGAALLGQPIYYTTPTPAPLLWHSGDIGSTDPPFDQTFPYYKDLDGVKWPLIAL